MSNQKESYLKERNYLIHTYGIIDGNISEKQQFWEDTIGKAKMKHLAVENEKIAFHLQNVPYTVTGERKKQSDTVNTGLSQENEDVIRFIKRENPVFAPFYIWILQEAARELEQKRRNISFQAKVEEDFFRYVLNCLQKMTVRTLILEMRQLKAEGKLLGKNEEEEYQDFLCGYLSDVSYIHIVEERYPVLFRIIREQMEQCVDYFCEIMEHLEADRQDIEKLFLQGDSIRELSSIRCMYGDTHHNGKSVACICLNGEVEAIYKPHSLENERLFQDILKKISKSCSLWDDRMELKLISHSAYGWEEKICFQECGTEEGVKRFYQRAGISIFLACLFGTTDIHCENMIARGEYPVLIDLETLISLRESKDTQNPVFDSVLKSGILPIYLPGGNGLGNEVGALCGQGGRKSKMKIPVIRDAYSSKMRIEYRQGMINDAQNRVRYQGTPVEAIKYRNDIISGFQAAYSCVQGSAILQKDILESVENCKSRQLVSDTMKYAALLNSSYYPDLLTDGGDREMFVRTIGMIGKPRDRQLVECEVESMLCGDIPYFYNQGKHMMYQHQICIPEYFSETPEQAVQRRLMRLGHRDERLQIRLIELSLEIAEKMEKGRMDLGDKQADSQKETIGKQVSREQLISICEMLSELIVENMYEDEEGDLQVLSIDLSEQCRTKIRRVSRYFYEGIAGIIVFLYALEKEAKSHKATTKSKEKVRIRKKAADRLFAQLKEYTENLDTIVCRKVASGKLSAFSDASDDIQGHAGRTGMFDGEYSIVFAYLLLYEIQEEDEYLWFAEMHAKKSFPLIQQDHCFDLIGGNAGAILVLLKLFDITEKEEYLQMAVTAGEILCGQAETMECGIGWRGTEKTALCGMAHGNSGILVAVCRLYQKTKNKKLYDICLQGLAYEDSMYDEAVHDWKDLREEPGWRGDAGRQ